MLKMTYLIIIVVFKVPRSQILCAINGMIVGLTKVDPSIVILYMCNNHVYQVDTADCRL